MDDYPDREASKNLGSLKPVFEFLAPYKWQVAVASGALIVTASVTLSVGQGIRLILDEGFALGSPEVLMTSIAVFAALVVLLAAGTFTRFYYVSWVGERISADIRRAVYDHLIHMHPGFFQSNQPTEIQSRITTDTTLLQTVIGSSVSIALRNVIMFFGGLALLFVTNAKLSLLVVICAPVVVLPIIVFGRRVRRLSRASQDTLADVGSYAGESLRHIKVVQAFNHQAHDVKAFADRVNIAFLVAVRRIRQRAWLIALVMILVLAAIATMLWVGGQDVLAGTISGGELAAFIFYAFIVAGSVGAISEVWTDLQRAAGATERLIELLNAVSDLEEPARPVALRAPGSIEFKAVSFAYPARPEVQVLNEVSFKIEPGEMVALVGPSGAGKSTMFDLMQRFYDPSAGDVLVAGVPARDIALDTLRESIGVVPQDPTLFAGTLRDNLTYGDPDADEASCEVALRAAHAFQFIEALPEGLTTRIGEDGQGLSGGQRQRLAIARAMLVRPSILLMDEVTSALDAHSEDAIRETLAGLKGKCTVVIIAHRLSTVVQADRILVLDGGRIVGAGTHQELLSSNVLYKEFAEIQLTNVVLAAR